MGKLLIAIIVPVFNQVFYTLRFLESVRKLKRENYSDLKVVVVDNDSTDETEERVKKFQKKHKENLDVVYTKANKNLGYGRGITHGLCLLESQGEGERDIIACNNDMELEENCVDELVKTAYGIEECGIVGGKLVFPDGRVQHAGGFLNVFGWGQHVLGKKEGEDNSLEKVREVEYVTGALFYIKNELRERLPYFDDRYYMYMEEVDYCYMAREIGYKTFYTPYAKAIHYEAVTGKAVLKGNIEDVQKVYSNESQVKLYSKLDEVYRNKNEGGVKNSSLYKILINGKITGSWSFSGVLRNLSKGLSRNGVDVSIAPEEYHDINSISDWEIKQMIDKPNDYWNRTVLRSCEGDHMYLMPPGKERIGYVHGESSKVHYKWVEQLNNVDKVLTSSSFFRGVLESSGVKTPIFILPGAIDVELYNPEVKPLKLGELRKFKFFSMFHFGERKGPEILIKAFVEEFGPDEDVCLVIHSLSMEHAIKEKTKMGIGEWIGSITDNKPRALIAVTTNYLAEDLIPQYIKNFDCFVLPTRGEGFGLPIIEAAGIGIPSIVTGYSGVMDFMDLEVGWTIDYKLVDIPLQILKYFKNYIGGKWAEPSVEHLRELMRYAFENPEVVKAKGLKALDKAKGYSIDEIGKRAKEIIFN